MKAWEAFDRWVERAVLRALDPWELWLLRMLLGGVVIGAALAAWMRPETAAQWLFLQLAMVTFFFGLAVGKLWAVLTWLSYAGVQSGTLERISFAIFCVYALLIAGVTVRKFRHARQGQLQLSSALEMARQVQLSLQPPALVQWDYAAMATQIETARELGGDLVCWQRGKRGLFILVGDVMGKGAQAALTAAYVKGLFDEIAARAQGPDDVLRQLHQHLVRRTVVDSFLAAMCIELDPEGKCWRICRAGLPSAVLVRSDGVSVGTREGGIMLGIPIDPELVVTRLDHRPGDQLFLASDGLCEEEELPDKLVEALRCGCAGDLAQVLRDGIEALRSLGTVEKLDDETAVLIRWP
jgi:hypothetical protein